MWLKGKNAGLTEDALVGVEVLKHLVAWDASDLCRLKRLPLERHERVLELGRRQRRDARVSARNETDRAKYIASVDRSARVRWVRVCSPVVSVSGAAVAAGDGRTRPGEPRATAVGGQRQTTDASTTDSKKRTRHKRRTGTELANTIAEASLVSSRHGGGETLTASSSVNVGLH